MELLTTQLAAKAPLENAALTGTPTAPTAVAGTNTTQLATTAHVFAERANTATLTNKTLTAPAINGARSGTAWDIADRAPISPSLDLDFEHQRYRVLDGAVGLREIALADLMTYTGSGRTYTDALGILRAQASNVPRITFDPVTGAGLGLSVWNARTNLFLHSSDFTQAAWLKTSTGVASVPVVTAAAGIAPDGTNTAQRIVFALNGSTTSGDRSNIEQVTTNTALQPCVAGIWLRTESGTAMLRLDFAGAASDLPGTTSLITVTTTWTRFTAGLVSQSDTARSFRFGLRAAVGTSDSATVLAWQAQRENNATTISPDIPTTTAAVTAPADVASITGTNFSKWWNPSEGTFVVVLTNAEVLTTSGQAMLQADDGSNTNRIAFLLTATNAVQLATAITSGAAGSVLPGYTAVPGTPYAVASSYKTNDLQARVNGGAAATDATVDLPAAGVINRLVIGGSLRGTIARILYFPRALPSSLQALSA